jgi:hypothetical protein
MPLAMCNCLACFTLLSSSLLFIPIYFLFFASRFSAPYSSRRVVCLCRRTDAIDYPSFPAKNFAVCREKAVLPLTAIFLPPANSLRGKESSHGEEQHRAR